MVLTGSQVPWKPPMRTAWAFSLAGIRVRSGTPISASIDLCAVAGVDGGEHAARLLGGAEAAEPARAVPRDQGQVGEGLDVLDQGGRAAQAAFGHPGRHEGGHRRAAAQPVDQRRLLAGQEPRRRLEDGDVEPVQARGVPLGQRPHDLVADPRVHVQDRPRWPRRPRRPAAARPAPGSARPGAAGRPCGWRARFPRRWPRSPCGRGPGPRWPACGAPGMRRRRGRSGQPARLLWIRWPGPPRYGGWP